MRDASVPLYRLNGIRETINRLIAQSDGKLMRGDDARLSQKSRERRMQRGGLR